MILLFIHIWGGQSREWEKNPSAGSIFKYYSTSMSSRRKLNTKRNRYHHPDELTAGTMNACLMFFNYRANCSGGKTKKADTREPQMSTLWARKLFYFCHQDTRQESLNLKTLLKSVAIISKDYHFDRRVCPMFRFLTSDEPVSVPENHLLTYTYDLELFARWLQIDLRSDVIKIRFKS